MKTLGYLDIIEKYTLAFKEEILEVNFTISLSFSFQQKITEKYYIQKKDAN